MAIFYAKMAKILGYQVIPKAGYGVCATQAFAPHRTPQAKYSWGRALLLYGFMAIRLHSTL